MVNRRLAHNLPKLIKFESAITASTPLSSSGPRSDDKAPPAKSARMLQPGIEANRSCSGVELKMVGTVGVNEWGEQETQL